MKSREGPAVEWGDALLRIWGRVPELAVVAAGGTLLAGGLVGIVAVAYTLQRVFRGGGGEAGLVPLAGVLALAGALLSLRVLRAAVEDLRRPLCRAEGRVVQRDRLALRGRTRYFVVVAMADGRRLGFQVEESLWRRAGLTEDVAIAFTDRLRYLRSIEPRAPVIS